VYGSENGVCSVGQTVTTYEGGNTSVHGILDITEPNTSDYVMPFGITFRRIKWMLSR